MDAKSRQGRYGLALVTAVGVMGVATVALVAAPRVSAGYTDAPEPSVARLSLPLAPSGVLRILNAGGHIAVSVWDGERALLTITREVTRSGNPLARWFGAGDAPKKNAVSPKVRENEAGVEVSTMDDSPGADDGVNYRIDVKLPRGRGLAASNGNGPITVAGVEGDVTAISENGDVRCDGVTGNVAAKARNGSVYCRSVSGGIDANAANGSVNVDSGGSAEWPVRIWTTNGPIRFHAVDSTMNLHAATENGRVVADEYVAGANVRRTLRTLDASGGEGDAEVELHAVNGNIYVDPS